MKKDKEIICQYLLDTVQATGADIADIKYCCDEVTDDAFVNITWTNGYTKSVDVTADSGIAMIKDVLRHIA